jgi:predicted nucleotidyltransferase
MAKKQTPKRASKRPATKPETSKNPSKSQKKKEEPSVKITPKQMKAAKRRQKTFYKMKMKAAERFSILARQKLGNMLKGVGIIGSLARGDFVPGSDIDILVVIDDTKRDVPQELKEKLLAMLNKMGRDIDKKMQVQIHTLTEMFQFAKEGDNIIYNFLRHMKIVYDGGMLTPMRRLLKAGEIKPSKEAMMRSMEGAEHYMKKVEQYTEWILERYYRGVTWSANAYIMSLGENPVSVPEIPIVLQQKVDQGMLPQEVPAIAAEVIKHFKAVEHDEEEPSLKVALELEDKVHHMINVVKKEVVGSLVSESVGTAVKSKIKTMPKMIFEFGTHRAFVWLLGSGIYMAVYRGEKLDKVYKAEVDEGKVAEFKPTQNEKLFQAMEQSGLKPLINAKLIKNIFSMMPTTVRAQVKKLAVEYPGRAMLDLTDAIKLM